MYYRTLGLKQSASQEEIRKSFRALAVKYHPDKPGGSQELFQKLQSAYEVLSNENTRGAYDAELAKQKTKLRGFKRPPPLVDVRYPVLFKLSDDEYYEFETAPDKLKCTFKHGDIITMKNELGCFVGIAADNFFYWCRDGHSHAMQLCERGSFGEDCVKVVRRANLKGHPVGLGRAMKSGGAQRKSSDEKVGNQSMKDKLFAESERLRRDIMEREKENFKQERMQKILEAEEARRVRLVEKIEAARADDWQCFVDWLARCSAEGGNEKVDELPWIKHDIRKRANHDACLKGATG